jgi:hypothetical protein
MEHRSQCYADRQQKQLKRPLPRAFSKALQLGSSLAVSQT